MILVGDCLEHLCSLPDGAARCCVTSPPYWGLRDYGEPGQLGLEKTPQEYVDRMVAVFREVRRVLADDGTLWLNIGDCYAAGGRDGGMDGERGEKQRSNQGTLLGPNVAPPGLKPKDLVGIPWRVAFALQDDGWWLRSDIIWAKPNPMPESVTDRPTKAHEYLFLLSKSARYYYDAAAIAEPASCPDPRLVDGFVPKSDNGKHAGLPQSAAARGGLAPPDANGSTLTGGKTGRHHLGDAIPEKERRSDKQRGHGRRHAGFNDRWDKMERDEQCSGTRNKRSVWTIPPAQFRGAHFATFPTALVEPCIKAGSAPGDTVLDPFFGAGTTGLVASRLGREYVGIELNPEYAEMARERIRLDAPLFAEGS